MSPLRLHRSSPQSFGIRRGASSAPVADVLLDTLYLAILVNMTRKKELLIDEALRLPEEDRADLAAKLIESLDGDPDNDVGCRLGTGNRASLRRRGRW
jgi:hypothetical protein